MGRRKGEGRREPVMSAPGAIVDLRLGPDDRPAVIRGPDTRSAPRAPRDSEPRTEPIPARASPTRREPKRERARSAPRRKSGWRRLFYWTFVLGLWAVIGVTGLIVYEASQLPPIQNLAIPER